jgi:hypothetical protein
MFPVLERKKIKKSLTDSIDLMASAFPYPTIAFQVNELDRKNGVYCIALKLEDNPFSTYSPRHELRAMAYALSSLQLDGLRPSLYNIDIGFGGSQCMNIFGLFSFSRDIAEFDIEPMYALAEKMAHTLPWTPRDNAFPPLPAHIHAIWHHLPDTP